MWLVSQCDAFLLQAELSVFEIRAISGQKPTISPQENRKPILTSNLNRLRQLLGKKTTTIEQWISYFVLELV